MDEIVLLTSLAMFLLLAAGCSILFNRIKLPPLIGYLMAGIIVANFLTINETGETVVEMLSDMGLIMLMFCIGMEINLKKLRKQGVLAMKVAFIEIPFMVLGGMIVGTLLGLTSIQSICLGAVIAGSSTAVVLGVLKMQNRLNKDEIDTLILVIIMEDISQVIILSMITPLMAGSELDAGGLAAMVVSILVFMVASIVVGVRFMPRIVNWMSDTVSSEIVVITCVGLAFGMALLANYIGLSVAIGAFLMGMMIASSRRSKDVLHDIEPMKNIFMAMFFISVGMEISLVTLIDTWQLMLIFTGMFIGLKVMAVFLGYWLASVKAKESFTYAVSFLAMGEFAFIISKQAFDYNVFSDAIYTSIVGAALLSMILLPLISGTASRAWDGVRDRCPRLLYGWLVSLDNTKSTFYNNIMLTSTKTRKEVAATLNATYMLVILIAIIQILFILVIPYIRDWGLTYFGGNMEFWSSLLLLFNLLATYLPVYRLIENLKALNNIARKKRNALPKNQSDRTIVDKLLESNTPLLALMIGICILIIVPNGIELLEHFVALFIALILLLFINKKSLSKKEEMDSYDVEDEEFNNITTESFKKMMADMVAKEKRAEEKENKVVSINTGDFK